MLVRSGLLQRGSDYADIVDPEIAADALSALPLGACSEAGCR